MLALVSTSTTKPRFRFPAKATKRLRSATLTDVIWNLHAILTNPSATLDEAKAAKHRMLRVLEEATKFPLPQMIVAPMTLPPERDADDVISSELPDDAAVCRTCGHAATPARSRPTLTKRARAISSRSLRAKHSATQRGAASSHVRPDPTKQPVYEQNPSDQPHPHTSALESSLLA